MPNWRNEYRRCDNCRSEYRPRREAQSYCSRRCRRQAAYGPIETGSYKPTNWIEKLNQAAANEIDRAYWTGEKRKWPVDFMGGARHSARRPTLTVNPKLRQTILNTEQLLKDDEPASRALVGELEYCEDGYPKLPECLDRRVKPLLAQAA
jgi:hypothetical protein